MTTFKTLLAAAIVAGVAGPAVAGPDNLDRTLMERGIDAGTPSTRTPSTRTVVRRSALPFDGAFYDDAGFVALVRVPAETEPAQQAGRPVLDQPDYN